MDTKRKNLIRKIIFVCSSLLLAFLSYIGMLGIAGAAMDPNGTPNDFIVKVFGTFSISSAALAVIYVIKIFKDYYQLKYIQFITWSVFLGSFIWIIIHFAQNP